MRGENPPKGPQEPRAKEPVGPPRRSGTRMGMSPSDPKGPQWASAPPKLPNDPKVPIGPQCPQSPSGPKCFQTAPMPPKGPNAPKGPQWAPMLPNPHFGVTADPRGSLRSGADFDRRCAIINPPIPFPDPRGPSRPFLRGTKRRGSPQGAAGRAALTAALRVSFGHRTEPPNPSVPVRRCGPKALPDPPPPPAGPPRSHPGPTAAFRSSEPGAGGG